MVEIVGEPQYSFQEIRRNANVRIQEKEPPTSAEAAAFIHGPGEAPIGCPAAQRHTLSPPDFLRQRVPGRMIIHNHDFDVASLRTGRSQKLTKKSRGLFPEA